MGCLSVACRILIVIINTASMLIGLGLLASGAVLLLADRLFEEDMEKLIDDSAGLGTGAGFENSTAAPSDKQALIEDTFEVAQTLGIVLCIAGGVIFVVSLLGCIGGCCVVKCALVLYAIIAFLIMVAIAVLGALTFTGTFKDEVRDELLDRLKDEYGGIDTYNSFTVVFNYIMIEQECCGINDYQDFTNTTWKATREFKFDGNSENTENLTMVAPVACCKVEGDFPDSLRIVNERCAVEPTNTTSNYKTGCWDSIMEDYIDDYRTYGIIVVAVVCFFFLLLMLMSFYILIHSRRD